jgi:PAS domain S-box-containing protein
MKNEEERLDLLNELSPIKRESCLVFGINKEGVITRFNDDFELITGKSKEEVINRSISSIFVNDPQSLEKWMDLIAQARANIPVHDIELPLQTKSGKEIIISWTNFPISEEDGTAVSSLNLVGTPIVTTSSVQNIEHDKEQKGKTEKGMAKSNKDKQKEQKKMNKKAMFAKKSKSKEPSDESSHEISENSEAKKKKKKKLKVSKKPKKENIKKRIKKEKEPLEKLKPKKKKLFKNKPDDLSDKIIKEFHEFKQIDKKDSEKIPSGEEAKPTVNTFLTKQKKKDTKKESNSSFFRKENKPVSKKYESKEMKKIFNELESENKKLKSEIIKLENKLELNGIKKNQYTQLLNQRVKFLLDCIGISKKRKEFNLMMTQMQQRKQKLEHLETDMIIEKKEFKQKIEEFFKWREKLEQLEQEIEKRRQYLTEQETFLNSQYDKVLNHELATPASYVTESSEQILDEPGQKTSIVEDENLFESLVANAAVLQRGRIKKVNKLFLEMLGYNEKELIGKHLVDFVSPIGLSGIEQHYVNRLKGVDDLSYTTVFLSKDQEEVPVNVSVKSGEFLGQRAEIATFKET